MTTLLDLTAAKAWAKSAGLGDVDDKVATNIAGQLQAATAAAVAAAVAATPKGNYKGFTGNEVVALVLSPQGLEFTNGFKNKVQQDIGRYIAANPGVTMAQLIAKNLPGLDGADWFIYRLADARSITLDGFTMASAFAAAIAAKKAEPTVPAKPTGK